MNRQAIMFVVLVMVLLMFVSCGNNEVSEPKTDEPINFEIITEDTESDEIVALFSIAGAQEPVICDVYINEDGVVNILDLVSVASALGNADDKLVADVDGDGIVNILDLAAVAGHFQ